MTEIIRLYVTSWGRAVPSSGQDWFVKVLTYLWVLSLAFQPTQDQSIFLLIRLEFNYIPKISFLAWLILDIALKKTLKL